MTPRPARVKITLKTDQLTTFMAAAGIRTNAELARRMGTVTESTVSRLRNKGYPPSAAVIVGLRRAFPDLTLEHFFDIEDDVEAAA